MLISEVEPAPKVNGYGRPVFGSFDMKIIRDASDVEEPDLSWFRNTETQQ